MDYKELKECLACGSKSLSLFQNLGVQPLVNNLKRSPRQSSSMYPVIVNKCLECSHEQLSISVSPKILYKDYLYRTGISKAHISFFENFAFDLKRGSVLDVGCNDGALLKVFKKFNFKKLIGIEPSKKLASMARQDGIKVINDFFPTKKDIKETFDIITAFNVFAHNADPLFFLLSLSCLLNKDGSIFILTTPSRIDNYYHEHISYFSLRSMCALADRVGLDIHSFKIVRMHDDGYLFELKKKKLPKLPITRIEQKPLVGYGASASGIFLLNLFNIKPEYIIDDNPLKQGKFVPGFDIPILPSSHIIKDERNLYILVTAHHLYNEIVAKVKTIRPGKKDIFIHPLEGVK